MDFRVQDHLDELRSPAVYGAIGPVEVIQTHVSVVCLCGDTAFKFKKAVALPFLDFSAVQLRETACRDELRLNRRLAPQVYRDVLPLLRTRDGLLIGPRDATGPQVVDWAVVMRRLPADRMLDVLLARNAVDEAAIRALARILADFHRRQRQAADATVRAAGSSEHLLAFLRSNFEETRSLRGVLFDAELFDAVEHAAARALPDLQDSLVRRAAAGAVIDGHGDFHARNVCMVEPPVIYDCLEFRNDLRCGDVAGDVAFMAMDLRHRGHRELALVFVDEYLSVSGDDDLRCVLGELTRYRAMVRAKVDALGWRDAAMDEEQHGRARAAARRHLRLCAYTLAEERGLRAVVACGLPASGKSFILESLAQETGWPIWSTDRLRKELLGVAPTDRLAPEAYAEQTSEEVYAALRERACSSTGPVILDGNHGRREHRDALRIALGGAVLFVWFRLEPAVAHARLRAREAQGDAVSDADVAVYERLRARFESPTVEEAALCVDGASPRESCLDRIATGLIARPTRP
ncbi:MAG: AAA family ATPase [Planctomycetota bacterium]